MLPMMIPLRIRNQNNQDTLYAQQRYSPCRYTTLSPRGDAAEDDDGGRGPGSLALDELNTMAGNAERKRSSLYSSDRDVTPTVLPAVDTIYHSEKLHALTNLVEKQGNTAITLQSPTPRFETPSSPSPHPGAYSPERFVGAFPILLDKVTPQSVRLSKERARADFEETFAIRSVNSVTLSPTRGATIGHIQPLRSLTATAKTATPSDSRMEWTGLQSAPLKPALTPRNAYTDSANRQLVLSARR